VDQTLEQILIRLYQSDTEVERLRAKVLALETALAEKVSE